MCPPINPHASPTPIADAHIPPQRNPHPTGEEGMVLHGKGQNKGDSTDTRAKFPNNVEVK